MSQTTNDKVWLITGCSSGFGRVLAEAAIEHGDRVVATARSVERLKDLAQRCGLRMLILPLDVTEQAQMGKHEFGGRRRGPSRRWRLRSFVVRG